MRVTVNLVIETTDYDGEKFKSEVKKLVADIDYGRNESRLVGFVMHQESKPVGDDWRDYWWNETNVLKSHDMQTCAARVVLNSDIEKRHAKVVSGESTT